MHIKREGHSPEGGKLSRLIKHEMMEGPTEHDTEDDANDDRDYPESHDRDSNVDEDIAEDLSMAPEIMNDDA